MSGRFNEPRLMGNCENCYYATDRGLKHKRLEMASCSTATGRHTP